MLQAPVLVVAGGVASPKVLSSPGSYCWSGSGGLKSVCGAEALGEFCNRDPAICVRGTDQTLLKDH